ncbi:hypothetical protein IE81DRAFT_327227 [Ceraceosorus guamensis]|uniref:Uncharacterized protein n=1 Tax=Ceraceosorus guamensis TaxID=1522189 RepID=A0A316VM96_9BASI|nr:hypothetical protein IE81DRAFT_327227 [Ceraceosorus guamensis]PWN38702.1 hypothetical protein IE81DRAFT_327227 [Ceraceosorus guamensis]
MGPPHPPLQCAAPPQQMIASHCVRLTNDIPESGVRMIDDGRAYDDEMRLNDREPKEVSNGVFAETFPVAPVCNDCLRVVWYKRHLAQMRASCGKDTQPDVSRASLISSDLSRRERATRGRDRAVLTSTSCCERCRSPNSCTFATGTIDAYICHSRVTIRAPGADHATVRVEKIRLTMHALGRSKNLRVCTTASSCFLRSAL